MPGNANVIERLVGAGSPAQGSLVIPSLTLGSNTATLFLNQLGATAIINPPGALLAAATTAPSYGQNLDGFQFRVRAAFKVTTGGTSTAIINIYWGTTLTAGNIIASVTSQSLVTLPASGFLQADLIWDSVSGKLWGTQTGVFGSGSTVAGAALTNTGLAPANQAALQFCIGANLGSNVAGSIFTVTEFCMETVS